MVNTAQVKRYVAAHLREIRGREDVAAALGLPLEPLRRAFLKQEGITLAEHIRLARVERAKRLLRETDLRCKEVCEAVGFGRVDDGERTFREAAGLTMRAYRERHRGRYRRG